MKIKAIYDNQFGDTIVEVMLAAAVLSVVMAGAFTLTNRATRLSQSANERTEVSNLMQREIELVRAKHAQQGDDFWSNTTTGIDTAYLRANKSENTSFCATGPNPHTNAFFMKTDPLDPDYLEVTKLDTGSGINDAYDDLFTVWIEASNDDDPPATTYTNFFVYACWEGIGGEGDQSSGLVMRLSR